MVGWRLPTSEGYARGEERPGEVPYYVQFLLSFTPSVRVFSLLATVPSLPVRPLRALDTLKARGERTPLPLRAEGLGGAVEGHGGARRGVEGRGGAGIGAEGRGGARIVADRRR